MPVTKVKSSWQTTVLRSRSNRWELQFWCAPTEKVKSGVVSSAPGHRCSGVIARETKSDACALGSVSEVV